MKTFKPVLILFLTLGLLAASCGGPAEPEVTPESILADAVAYMGGLAGFQFQISHEGSEVYLDPDNTVGFSGASGSYVAPDKAQTTVKISALGMVAEITVISLGDSQWASNPLTGIFQQLPDTYLFKPAQYLDPASGVFPSLGSGLTDLTMAEETEELEELPGLPLTHLSGTIPGSVISDVTKGLISVDSLGADLWIDTASGQIHRITLTDQAGEGEASSVWVFDFWGFGETVEITAP